MPELSDVRIKYRVWRVIPETWSLTELALLIVILVAVINAAFTSFGFASFFLVVFPFTVLRYNWSENFVLVSRFSELISKDQLNFVNFVALITSIFLTGMLFLAFIILVTALL